MPLNLCAAYIRQSFYTPVSIYRKVVCLEKIWSMISAKEPLSHEDLECRDVILKWIEDVHFHCETSKKVL